MQAMTRLRPSSDAGVIATHMAITIAFALFAVTQLTRTTVAAQQIDTRVQDIVGSVETINTDTKTVAVLDDTGDLTTQILAAAEPLNAQAQDVVRITGEIDGMAASILGNAETINGNVLGINDTAKGINSTVLGIGSTVGNINGNARNIERMLATLRPVVDSINDGVAGINRRGDVVIGISNGIKADTGAIRANVDSITGTANSIARSPGASLELGGLSPGLLPIPNLPLRR
jgi:methyl-accepting chemotaxis protein